MKTKNLLLLLCFCNFKLMAQEVPHLGDKWNGNILENVEIVFGSQAYPRAVILVNGISYTLGLSPAKDSVIKYILTNDPNFTVKGHKVINMKLKDFANINNPDKGKPFTPTWKYYIPLGEGWMGRLDIKNRSDSSKILSAFKYDFAGPNSKPTQGSKPIQELPHIGDKWYGNIENTKIVFGSQSYPRAVILVNGISYTLGLSPAKDSIIKFIW